MELTCKHCGGNYVHFLGSFTVDDDNHYKTSEVELNGKYVFTVKARYDYRSQGNIHLLFICENGDYFIKSFDGHKGNVHIDQNSLMEELEEHLNEQSSDSYSFHVDNELLQNIKEYFSKFILTER